MRPGVGWRRALWLVLLGALLGAAACGGGKESRELAPTQESSTPESGVVSTPGPVPTLDPNIRLVRYDSPDKGYSIDYPEGWQVEAAAVGAPDIFSWTTEEQGLMAQLTAGCTKGEGLTPEDVIAENSRYVGPYGIIDPTKATPVGVAGVTGKRLEYHTEVASYAVDHVAVFFVIGDCGWRIGLSAPVSSGLDQFLPLFDRVLASFHYSG